MMVEIDLGIPSTNTGNYLVVFGHAIQDRKRIKITCHISNYFLEEIGNSSTNYLQTFKNNKWSIEMLAEDKLSTNRDIEKTEHGIKITILAADKAEFDNLN